MRLDTRPSYGRERNNSHQSHTHGSAVGKCAAWMQLVSGPSSGSHVLLDRQLHQVAGELEPRLNIETAEEIQIRFEYRPQLDIANVHVGDVSDHHPVQGAGSVPPRVPAK